ncbi:MAG: hypothetical protein R3178_04060 [Rhodothermales bacterium]|nr:hypothetical protein [Rhodothermales bacterium]
MPCKYSLENDGRLVLERWYGVVSPDEILAQKSALLRDEHVAPGAVVLSDCRAAELIISQEAVQIFAHAEENSASASPIKRYGFLVNDDVYPHAQQFSNTVKSFGVTVIVFNSLEVAATWVGMEPGALRTLMGKLRGEAGS